ncbi:hypothetical protein CRE_04495 [Caenorhabditis remanei]|uniref:Uncharacterized protein n=1 Tax=Caenorhabditis remanei TaxID=31234 RepID=E3LYP5_CAERE|nr:hypothetical protein CRE_04495 [Caenorhabditis remanei]
MFISLKQPRWDAPNSFLYFRFCGIRSLCFLDRPTDSFPSSVISNSQLIIQVIKSQSNCIFQILEQQRVNEQQRAHAQSDPLPPLPPISNLPVPSSPNLKKPLNNNNNPFIGDTSIPSSSTSSSPSHVTKITVGTIGGGVESTSPSTSSYIPRPVVSGSSSFSHPPPLPAHQSSSKIPRMSSASEARKNSQPPQPAVRMQHNFEDSRKFSQNGCAPPSRIVPPMQHQRRIVTDF